MSFTNLDAVTPTVLVNGVASPFTVNYVTGVITITTAPPVGTNNVEITATKTFSGLANRILKITLKVKYWWDK